MPEATAMRVAIDLLRVPSRARLIRAAPLPSGMEQLLQVAVGDRAAIDAAVAQTERSEAVLRDAAAFFIEQILLSGDAASYRVLGTDRNAPLIEIRRNMALLVRWMHPDVASSSDRSMFASRVTQAWNDLKTSDRRQEYDKTNSESRTASRDGSRSTGLRRIALYPPHKKQPGR